MALTIKGLMKHLRENGVHIEGSKEKRELTNLGYYHGYKGYRFFKKSTNTIHYTEFSQLVSVINYDNKLKAILYPNLMFIETALKNVVISELVRNKTGDVSIDCIYKENMQDEQNNRELRLKRLKIKNKIHGMLSYNYREKNAIVSNFYDKGNDVPIWGIFEIISLGDFAYLMSCLDKETRLAIHKELNLSEISNDTGDQLLANILFTIKPLRNAVAHNQVIFDTRFSDRGVNKNLKAWLQKETNIQGINFRYITDYVILISCIMKKIKYDKHEIISSVKSIENELNILYSRLPIDIYDKIVSTEAKKKLVLLEKFLQ